MIRDGGRSARPEVRLHAGRIGTHTWSILAGLGALAAQGRIRLRHVPANGLYDGRAVLVEVDGHGIVFDVSDEPDLIGHRNAEVVFKRSYCGPYDGDVRPLGLVAGYRLGAERIIRHVAATARVHHDRRSARQLAKLVLGRGLPPTLQSFLAGTDSKKEQVLFQVRAWPGPPVESRKALTDSRARLIRALKDEFGPRFVGGFMPSPYALEAYPDCVTRQGYTPSEYATLIRESAVAVSTVGLEGSNPWKLVEYLAGSCAVVSEPLRSTLPTDLPAGVTVFNEGHPQACIAACRALLDSGHWRDQGMANRAFFEGEVRPDELMWKRLSEVAAARSHAALS